MTTEWERDARDFEEAWHRREGEDAEVQPDVILIADTENTTKVMLADGTELIEVEDAELPF